LIPIIVSPTCVSLPIAYALANFRYNVIRRFVFLPFTAISSPLRIQELLFCSFFS
jgi:hypothetical protein